MTTNPPPGTDFYFYFDSIDEIGGGVLGAVDRQLTSIQRALAPRYVIGANDGLGTDRPVQYCLRASIREVISRDELHQHIAVFRGLPGYDGWGQDVVRAEPAPKIESEDASDTHDSTTITHLC